ncbi:MAG: glycoside hydrolase family 2 TIM barrel-domain containing protein [Gemmiger sp.]|nr:glycoside hydrolase family 2 TIM barrel-domain containing protein [Gemmiger sp.]
MKLCWERPALHAGSGKGAVCWQDAPALQGQTVTLRLQSQAGETVAVKSCPAAAGLVELTVPHPDCWSPAQPRLYQAALCWPGGQACCTVGFGSLQRAGNQVLWNGQPIKLRGICCNEKPGMPLADIRRMLQLFKAANVNYLRALYRPFSPAFLALCDALGFFVEDAAPLNGIGGEGPVTQNSPAHREACYLAPLQEMVERDRQHICILIWSLGQDCVWGSNFSAMYRWLRAADAERLVTFHLPMTVPQTEQPLDVWPVHYRDAALPAGEHYDQMVIFHSPGAGNAIGYATGRDAGQTMPVIQDIYAPVPCANLEEIRRDPGIHEFWGESLKRHWQAIQAEPGCLGGAVLAAVDEVPDPASAIVAERDGWPWGVLHTDFTPKPEYHHLCMVYGQGDGFTLRQNAGVLALENSTLHYRFCRKSCQLETATVQGLPVLCGGPFLQATGLHLPPWQGTGCNALVRADGSAEVRLRGGYGEGSALEFVLQLQPDGTIQTVCKVDRWNIPMPFHVKAGIGLDAGGLAEKGIAFLAAPGMQRLMWEREGLWSWYPENHPGANTGTADRAETERFFSMKHAFRRARLWNTENRVQVVAVAQGAQSLRLEESPTLVLDDRSDAVVYQGDWYEVDENCGSRNGTETMSNQPGATATVHFTGTGITAYGAADLLNGHYDILLDGSPVATGLRQYPQSQEFAVMSRGYEKRYQVPMYQVNTLPFGPHSLTIRVVGGQTQKPAAEYVTLDYFVVESPQAPPALRVIVNQQFNYPRFVQGNYHHEKVVLQPGDLLKSKLWIGREPL